MSKKALIVGINYTGSEHALSGCHNDAYNIRDFLVGERGFSDDADSMIVMTDEDDNQGTWRYPTGANMLAAFKWLVDGSGPGDRLWLSYSGHGSQTRDTNGDLPGGYDDTICPVDYADNGQIYSGVLHDTLVSPLHNDARLTVLFDCCHSGSACELPFVYRPDADGNIVSVAALAKNAMREGAQLLTSTRRLLRGDDGEGFQLDRDTFKEASSLFGGFSDLAGDVKNLASAAWSGGRGDGGGANEDGLAEENHEWVDEHAAENKDVWMFSGCADNQTSADTQIAGESTGAMTWAFLSVMQQHGSPTYIDMLTNARELLRQKYTQIPQLSCGGEYDLDQRIEVSRGRELLDSG